MSVRISPERLLTIVFCLWSAALPAAQDIPFGQGLLFQVESDRGPPSHVFGTIHSEDPRATELAEPVQRAFDRAVSFAMEVVPDASGLLTSMLSMVMTDGRSLQDVVGQRRYDRAAQAVAKLGLPEASIRELKPWAVVALISVPPQETGELLDLKLYQGALEAGKRVQGLETIEEQLGVFDNLSEADQIALLDDALKESEQMPQIYQRVLATYLRRDLAGLVRLNRHYLQGGGADLAGRIQARLVDERNQRMVRRMRPLLTTGNAFVAVGALHLPGIQGILNLLQQQGYRIRREY